MAKFNESLVVICCPCLSWKNKQHLNCLKWNKREADDAGRFDSFPHPKAVSLHLQVCLNATLQGLPGEITLSTLSSDCSKGKCHCRGRKYALGGKDRALCKGRVQKGELREGDVWTHLEMTHSWFLCFSFAQLRSSGQTPWGSSDPGSVYNDLGNVYNNALSVYSQRERPKGLNLKSLKCFYLYFCDIQRSRDRGNVGLLRQPLNIPDQ